VKSLGKLKSLGALHPWSVPLLLPKEYRDYRAAYTKFEQFHLESDSPFLFYLHRKSDLSKPKWVGSGPKKTAMSTVFVCDENGIEVPMSFFGDTRDMSAVINNSPALFVYAKLEQLPDKRNKGQYRLVLNSPEIISPNEAGRIVPIYPGKAKVISPSTVKEKVLQSLTDLTETVVHLRQLLNIKSKEDQDILFQELMLPPQPLKSIILKCHYPTTVEEAYEAQRCLRLIAAKFALQVGLANRDDRVRPELAIPVTSALANKVVSAIPFSLTKEQMAAVNGMLGALAKPMLSRSTLSGDVGTGKTAVYGSVAACCAYAGAKVAILAPNTVLCEQIYTELSGYWPEIPMSKAWGDSAEVSEDAYISIGTTALINRAKAKGIDFNLVIVDEEHRFSREQKEDLMGSSSNYIGSTATLIPRTLQLVSMGAFDVYRLTTCHVKKIIHTHISEKLEDVHKYVSAAVSKGLQALIVMPIAQGENREKQTSEEAFQYWESIYPGRVALAHGKMKDAEKIAAITAMKQGEKDILVSTTVIEVGITIPKARVMVIYHPEVLGLATLHQLRGRLGRTGNGQSHLVLYLPDFVKDKTFERLLALKNETDGFKLAEADLKMRGFGDLAPNAEKQTGGMPSLLPNYEITVEDVEELDRRQKGYTENFKGYSDSVIVEPYFNSDSKISISVAMSAP
jgi:ATP-dependent DNA helicase RecG